MIKRTLLTALARFLFRAWFRVAQETAKDMTDIDRYRDKAKDMVQLQVQAEFDKTMERVWKAHLAGLVGVAEREARLASWWAGVGARAGAMVVTGVGR